MTGNCGRMATRTDALPAVAHIRSATSADLVRIPAIEQAAAGLFPEADLPLALRYQVTDMQDLRVSLDAGRLWVAALDTQQLVGYAMADVVDGQAYLVEVDVLPDLGRRGIGRRLVLGVADWARAAGFERLRLVTFRHLPWNAPFYANLGFTELAEAELGPELRALMAEEHRLGLNPAHRIAMQLAL